MNLLELFNAGGQYTAEAVLRREGGLREVTRALQNRFGNDVNFANNTLRALISRAQQSLDAAEQLTAGQSIPRGSLPQLPRGSSAPNFQYRVVVNTVIQTGPRRTDTETRRDVINVVSSVPIEKDVIFQKAREAIRNNLPDQNSPEILRAFNQQNRVRRIIPVRIISVYRR